MTPDTDTDGLCYEQREAASPESADFAGGHGCVFPVVILLAMALVLVFLLVGKETKP